MTIHPVLIPIPQDGQPTPPQRVRRQRDSARVALRHCAKLCGAPIQGWRQDDNRVPLPNAGFHWSITHKKCWAAAVIADHPIGIDIEQVMPRKDHLFDALGSDEEWRIVGGQSWPLFFRLWTAKEAVLKANGKGIGGLLDCRLINNTAAGMALRYGDAEWCVEHFEHDGHIAAVTATGEPIHWTVLSAGASSDIV